MKLVVFDMAGTTLDDEGLVLASFVSAARAVELEATPEELEQERKKTRRRRPRRSRRRGGRGRSQHDEHDDD